MQVSNSQANKNQKSNSIPRVKENNKNLKCTNFECKFSVIKASGMSEKNTISNRCPPSRIRNKKKTATETYTSYRDMQTILFVVVFKKLLFIIYVLVDSRQK